jgi:hypothetical protein
MKLVQHFNLTISTVNGYRGWTNGVVQIAELERDTQGQWIATPGTVEKLTLHNTGDLCGFYEYNDSAVEVNLLSHVTAINELLAETLNNEVTEVVNYKGMVDKAGRPIEKLTYELRPNSDVQCQQPDGQILRVWPIWVSDKPIPKKRDPSTLNIRIFAQYAQSVKRTGFL